MAQLSVWESNPYLNGQEKEFVYTLEKALVGVSKSCVYFNGWDIPIAIYLSMMAIKYTKLYKRLMQNNKKIRNIVLFFYSTIYKIVGFASNLLIQLLILMAE